MTGKQFSIESEEDKLFEIMENNPVLTESVKQQINEQVEKINNLRMAK